MAPLCPSGRGDILERERFAARQVVIAAVVKAKMSGRRQRAAMDYFAAVLAERRADG
jgi:hypothetical protein